MGFVWLMVPAMARFGINASVLRDTTPYIRALNWSAPPLMLFFCLRRYLQSIGVVRPILLGLDHGEFGERRGQLDLRIR